MKTSLKQMALLIISLLLGPQFIYAQVATENAEVIPQQADLMLSAKSQLSNLFEIDAAKIALEKSEDNSIREYAKRIITEREKLAEEYNILIAHKKWQLPDADRQVYENQLEILRYLEPGEFDAQYLQVSLNNHNNTIKEFKETISNENADSDLKKILTAQIGPMETNIEWITAYKSPAKPVSTMPKDE